MADIKVGFKADPSSLSGILAEIQKTVGNGLKDLSVSIKEIDMGGAASKFADSLNAALERVDFSKSLNIGEALSGTNTAIAEVVNQLGEVKTTLNEINGAIKNSSIEDMVTKGTGAIGAMVAKLQGVSDLLDQINSKEFSISQTFNNFSKQSGVDKNWFALQTQQATELKSVIAEIQSAISMTNRDVKGLMGGDSFSAANALSKYQLPKNMGTQTGVISGIADMNSYVQKGIEFINQYNAAVAKIGNGKIPEIPLPDLTQVNEAVRALQEYERAERAATSAATGSSKGVSGVSGDLNAIDELIKSITGSFNSLKEVINNTFDFSVAKGELAALKEEIDTLGTGLDEVQRSINRVRNARIAADEKAAMAAQSKLLSSESTETKRLYDSMLRGGYTGEEVEQVKQKYSEWVSAIEQVKAASSAASSEQIASLQAEGDAIRQSIASIQQKANAEQAAAKAAASASAQSQKNAEKEEKAEERAAQAKEQAAVREANLQKQNAAMRSRISTFIDNNTKAYGMFKTQIDSMLSELSQEGGVSKERLAQIATEFTNIQTAARNAGALGQTFFQKLQEGWSRFGGWALVTRSFMLVVNGVKKMIESVKELDLAMTELKKVTDLTSVGYENFYQNAANAATQIGASVSDTVNATADFARLGYDVSDALQLAEASIIYKNVGDGITDISQSTESLISTIKAFKLEATDAMTVVDELNEVGKLLPMPVVTRCLAECYIGQSSVGLLCA